MKLEDIRTVTMYGGGVIGGGFAAYFALKGLNVNVFVRSAESVERSRPKIQDAVDTYVKYGLIRDGQAIWDRIRFTTDPSEAFTDVYFVQENGAENVEQKRGMVRVMEQYLPADAIIASSSSGTPCTRIAEGAVHPERIVVAHPFTPVYLLPLIEICGGEKTSPETLALVRAFYSKYDKAPVVLHKEKMGFIANRLMHAVWREESALMTEGVCSMADCDDAWTFGPGIRLAAIGPAMNYELGGGELGLKGCAIKFGAMTDAVFADLSDMKCRPAGLADQCGEEIGHLMDGLSDVIGHTKPEIADFRDDLILRVLKMHEKL